MFCRTFLQGREVGEQSSIDLAAIVLSAPYSLYILEKPPSLRVPRFSCAQIEKSNAPLTPRVPRASNTAWPHQQWRPSRQDRAGGEPTNMAPASPAAGL